MFAFLLFDFDSGGCRWSRLFCQYHHFLFHNNHLSLLLLLLLLLLADDGGSDHQTSRPGWVRLLLMLMLTGRWRLRDARNHLGHLRWWNLSYSQR